MCSSDLGRNPAAFPAVESQSCGSGASGSCRPAPDASGEEAAARHREQIAGKDNRMSDTTLARAAFDARLHELKLHDLASHEIDRLWKSRLKQLEISARLASHQIGSASCRERVCQSVSISVVEVYIKKKNIKNKITATKKKQQ